MKAKTKYSLLQANKRIINNMPMLMAYLQKEAIKYIIQSKKKMALTIAQNNGVFSMYFLDVAGRTLFEVVLMKGVKAKEIREGWDKRLLIPFAVKNGDDLRRTREEVLEYIQKY